MNSFSLGSGTHKMVATLAIFALFLTISQGVFSVVQADHDAGAPYEGEILGVTIDKIRICHGTSSGSNPYTNPEVNINSFFSGGHDSDFGDIIPPFHYDEGNGTGTESFAGMNWNTSGIEIWENNCAIPNAQPVATGTLSVTKQIVGTTTVDESAFSFTINGASTTAFEADGQNDLIVATGTYSIAEVPAPGFTTTYNNCSNVLVAAGATEVCTITNTAATTSQPIATGTLSVVKQIVGTTTVDESAFSFLVNGAATTTFESDGQNDLTLNVGAYTIVEVPVSGFTTTYNNCTNVSVTQGGTETCTITNTAISQPAATGTLSVVKQIFGTTTATSSDFFFTINGVATTTFEPDGQNDLVLATGTYSISEVAAVGFTTTYSNTKTVTGCDNLVINAGETVTCFITNVGTTTGGGGGPVATGTLQVVKTVVGSNDTPDLFTYDVIQNSVTTVIDDAAFNVSGTSTHQFNTGIFDVVENARANYTIAYANSENNDADCDNLTVTPGATSTCWVTNTFTGGNGGDGNGGGNGGGGNGGAPVCNFIETDIGNDEATLTWSTQNGSDLQIFADGNLIFSTSTNSVVASGSFLTSSAGIGEFELTVSGAGGDDTCSISINGNDTGGISTGGTGGGGGGGTVAGDSTSNGGNGGGGGGVGGPTPQVLGDQVSVVPVGGANAGAGGAAAALPLSWTLMLLVSIATLRATRNA